MIVLLERTGGAGCDKGVIPPSSGVTQNLIKNTFPRTLSISWEIVFNEENTLLHGGRRKNGWLNEAWEDFIYVCLIEPLQNA